MLVPQTIYQNFAVKVYSCKVNTLQLEQKRKREYLLQKLENEKDVILSGKSNDIYPFQTFRKEKLKNLQESCRVFWNKALTF